MRSYHYQNNDYRLRKGFLHLPLKGRYETRWLEYAYWKEVYRSGYGAIPDYWDIIFIDKEEYDRLLSMSPLGDSIRERDYPNGCMIPPRKYRRNND